MFAGTGAEMPKTVLIVEDDKASANLLMDLLHLEGHETMHVEEGWKAMDMVTKHRPDLIIMDIQLPDISGVKVTRMLKASGQFKDVPIITVTAFGKEWTEEKCREAGCDVYMSKPISVPDFLETVAKFIG